MDNTGGVAQGGQGNQGGIDPNTLKWLQSMGLFGSLGQLGGGIFGLFNKGKNPADVANQYLDQIPGNYGDLKNEYGDLLHGDVYNRLASGYQESPGYKFNLESALHAAGNQAAAGGKLGTQESQRLSAETAQGIASKDFQDYLNHQLGLYGQGLSGSQDLANMLSNVLGQKAQYGYAGQAGQNQARGNAFGDIFGGIAGGLGSIFGGPAGGWIGKHIFGSK